LTNNGIIYSFLEVAVQTAVALLSAVLETFNASTRVAALAVTFIQNTEIVRVQCVASFTVDALAIARQVAIQARCRITIGALALLQLACAILRKRVAVCGACFALLSILTLAILACGCFAIVTLTLL
jgi:hypothetical protein